MLDELVKELFLTKERYKLFDGFAAAESGDILVKNAQNVSRQHKLLAENFSEQTEEDVNELRSQIADTLISLILLSAAHNATLESCMLHKIKCEQEKINQKGQKNA
jgi:hypothetical protein